MILKNRLLKVSYIEVRQNYKMVKKNCFLLFTTLLISCSSGYENDGKIVSYKYWNEGTGSHKFSLEADPKSFTVLKHDRYAKDKKYVFFDGQIIPNADPATFESLDEFYARDKFRGYYDKDSIISSKGTTFKVIDSYYSTDGHDIFYTTYPLKVCSVENFRVVYEQNNWERWTTDGCYYFFKHYKIPSKDYNNVSFFKGSAGLAKDRRWVYFLDRKLNYNDEGKQILDTVDVSSFEVTDYIECKDKFGCINVFQGREECEK
ncbi:DKNYY domain-containing protein (plasmid) [Adhaeribacter swui]|uniref:DKNYY domain-containing protein n=1 Tax=Adhaeribacter swui TaxID=2086471 RepID=A0A7G7G230_9BACT|nr:DKNYY domain-containing protein [Adhaeribacter swui]QNF31214.1 DKNYY domain-containing protein [Adhaeribacter swui]